MQSNIFPLTCCTMNIFIIFLLALVLCKPESEAIHTNRSKLLILINQNQSTWTAGHNFPEDVSSEDLKRLNGALLDIPHEIETKKYNVGKSQIPEFFDARDAWPECSDVIGYIRDQGQCGSCWAFASAETVSDRFCIESQGKVKTYFSPEDLLQCCSNCVPEDKDTCNGGYVSKAWLHFEKGVVSGGDYNSEMGCKPYSGSAYLNKTGPSSCQENCQSNYNITYSDDKQSVGEVYKVSEVVQIQTEIMTNGPVTAMYVVYEDFYLYTTGIYQHITGDDMGNHAVKILGWGTENGVPYWLVANSWGKNWGGLGGFFKILRGQNHCGIEDFVLAGKSAATRHVLSYVLTLSFVIVIKQLKMNKGIHPYMCSVCFLAYLLCLIYLISM